MSAMIKHDTDIANLIKLEQNGIKIASYVEIREALINKFKFIYGNDIDVSPASADGQYIGELALLINNILQVVEYSYSSMDPASATGKYLDILASFNNISRKNETKSKAQLTIRNIGSQRSDIDSLQFVDNNGKYWSWTNKKDINGSNRTVFPSGTSSTPSFTTLENVTCDTPGKITAIGTPFTPGGTPQTADWSRSDRGTISQFVGSYPDFLIWQSETAETGEIEESDSSLRTRRYQMLGNQSISVLQGLQGSLLSLLGIKDVFIYNNAKDSDQTISVPTSDGTNIKSHSVYIALRYNENVNIPDVNIGELIYNKMTPGILTTPYHNETTFGPDGRGTTYSEAIKYTINKTAELSYDIYWKKCSAIHPTITITYVPNASVFDKDTIKDSVRKSLLNYLDNVSISGYLNPVEILSAMQKGDITNNPSNNTGTEKSNKSGISTFFATSCTITGAIANDGRFPANLCYFKYPDDDAHFTWDTTNHTLTITG